MNLFNKEDDWDNVTLNDFIARAKKIIKENPDVGEYSLYIGNGINMRDLMAVGSVEADDRQQVIVLS